MRYSAEWHEILFGKEVRREDETTPREWGKKLNHKAVGRYCTKRVICGEYQEWQVYPVWKWQRDATRAKKARPTEAAQRMQNAKNSRRRLVWLLNTNFTNEDIFNTLTYRDNPPQTVEEARADMQAYIRRVKRWRQKNELPEMRYIYTIETVRDGRKTRVHHHIVMSGMPRDVAESLWGKGRANASKLQPDEYGFEGLARYMIKTQGQRAHGERLWSASRNLTEPTVRYSYSRLSRAAIATGAADEAELRAIIEHGQPGFFVNDITINHSDMVPGAYVTVRLRRIAPRGGPPNDRATTNRQRPQRRKP